MLGIFVNLLIRRYFNITDILIEYCAALKPLSLFGSCFEISVNADLGDMHFIQHLYLPTIYRFSFD